MITPYKSIEFDNDSIIDRDTVNQMHNNLQWILENTPRGRFYGEAGRVSDVRVVMICGRVGIGKSKKEDTVLKSVRFPKAFAPNCNPNVTTGIISDSAKQIFCVVNGPGGKTMPDSTGFDLQVNVPDLTPKDKWAIKKPFYVHWQAYGFRQDDL